MTLRVLEQWSQRRKEGAGASGQDSLLPLEAPQGQVSASNRKETCHDSSRLPPSIGTYQRRLQLPIKAPQIPVSSW